MIINKKQIEQIRQHLVGITKQDKDGIAIVDIVGIVRFVNPLWAMMHGYSCSDELIGKHISVFHTKEQMEADVVPFMEETKRGSQLAGPIKHIKSDGMVFSTQTKMLAVRDKQGNVIGLVIFAVDTTQNNPGQFYFTDQTIEPVTAANDEPEQQMTEQKVNSDSQTQESIADIETKIKAESAKITAQIKAEVEEKNNLYAKDVEQAQNRAKSEAIPKVEAKQKENLRTQLITRVPQHQAEQSLPETITDKRIPEKSLRDLCYVFFRHKWKMALFFFAVIAIVTVATLLYDKIYCSEAKLLVQLGRESVTLDPTATTGQIIQISQSRENEINSELEILKSRELIERVVESIGAEKLLKIPDEKFSIEDKTPEALRKTKSVLGAVVGRLQNLIGRFGLIDTLSDRDKATLKVIKNLKIKNLKDSSIINISYEAKSPKLAQEVVTKVIDLYLEKHIVVHQTPGSHKFFVQQSDQLRNKLMQSENELRNLKNETGISSVTEQQLIILTLIGTLKQDIDQTEKALASSEAKTEALQRTLAEVPETVVTEFTTGFPNLRADEMRKQLYELQLEELKLRTNFTDNSPPVKSIRQEIAEAQALFNKEEPDRTQITTGLSKTHEELQSALLTEKTKMSALKVEADLLRKQLADAQVELKTLNDAETKIKNLTREAKIQEANYQKYSDNLEQARIDHAMESERISNISVVQAATLPIKAIRPKKLLNLALGFFIGILGAIVLATFSEHLDHSIKTPEEVEERLQLPVLASIPRVHRVFPKVKLKQQQESNEKVGEKISVKLDIPVGIKECCESFRERLLLCSNGSEGTAYVLAVIGCQRHEGVSAVAANLAATLSQHHENGNVLLIDTNISHPSVHKVFKAKLSPGLTDIFTNGQYDEDIIWSLPNQNLHILSAGAFNGNLSETFNSGKFEKLLNSVKNHYSSIVIDIPALSEARSTTRLASLCDGVVLVVGAERLRWEVTQRAKKQLLDSNANIIGVVLNKRRFYIPRWLYNRL